MKTNNIKEKLSKVSMVILYGITIGYFICDSINENREKNELKARV